MVISSLVITLSDDDAASSAVLAELQSIDRVEMGAMHGRRLPIVIESRSPEEGRVAWQRLRDLPGVVFVDVVLVHLECDDAGQDHGHAPEARSR